MTGRPQVGSCGVWENVGWECLTLLGFWVLGFAPSSALGEIDIASNDSKDHVYANTYHDKQMIQLQTHSALDSRWWPHFKFAHFSFQISIPTAHPSCVPRPSRCSTQRSTAAQGGVNRRRPVDSTGLAGWPR